MTVRVLNKEGLRSIIAGLTGLSDGATLWELDPQSYISDTDRARVTLEVIGMGAVGVDEHRRQLSDGTDGYPAGTFWTQELGNRHVRLTVKAEAFDAGVEACEFIDAVRTGIRADASTAALNAIALAFVWAEEATPLKLVINERRVNMAVADFTFAGIAQQVSNVIPPGVGGDYIAVVNGNNVVPGTFS